MGLSASQGRFLSLTAKKSDLELEAQQVAYKRTRLAATMEEVEAKYSERINNTMLKFKNGSSNNMTTLTYEEFTKNEVFKEKYLTNENGKIVVGSADMIPSNISDKEKAKYIVDDQLNKGGYLEDVLKDGIYFITEKDKDGKEIKTDIGASSLVIEDYDISDDAVAKAEYDAAMNKAQREDKKLELLNNQIDSEHKAIETELESVQKVIQQNIENSYKTFSG